jgi:hypothetical protein
MTVQGNPTSTASAPAAPAARFQWRAFATLSVAIGSTMLAASGLALYVAPAGRIANWTGWTLLALTKAQWQALHMVFGIVVAAAASLHVYFNWRVLLFYLRSKARRGLHRRRELALASGLAMVLALMAAESVPPVSLVAGGREALSEWWSTSGAEPPVPHMELLTVAQVAETLKIAPEDALARLERAGIGTDAATPLGRVASARGSTPAEVYRLMAGDIPPAPPATTIAAAGLGRRALGEVARAAGLAPDEALGRLRSAGIEARLDDTLHDIAARSGRRAPDVAKLLGIAAAQK